MIRLFFVGFMGGLSMRADRFVWDDQKSPTSHLQSDSVTMVKINKEEQPLHSSAITQADASSYKGGGKSEHAAGLCRFL